MMNWSIFRYLVVIALPGVVMGQDREVSWKELLPNFLEDQRSMWAFPARLGDPHDFLPAIAVAGVEAGLILEADPPAAHYFRNTSAFGNFNNIFSSNNTAIGTAVVPASLLIVGLITKDKKMKDTALFTAEAVADAEVLTTVLKAATARARPVDLAASSGFGDSFWDGKPSSGGFPSGHTNAAFSVATIISRRYGKQHRWVSFASYAVATAVGFSRLSLSEHFLSDVFLGAALGYSISRFTVLRE